MILLNIPNIYLAYIIVTLLFLLLSGIIILLLLIYQKRRILYLKEMTSLKQTYEQALLQSQIEVQESTLSTLSKDLHDNVGQLLSTAKMLLGITERNIQNPPDTLKTANATVGQAINELRSLSKSLSKEWLEQFNLIENLTTEVNRLNSADGVTLHLSLPDKLLLKADEQIILFRIIQEAIQNAIKHAFPTNIYISLSSAGEKLVTWVKDDGKGLELSNKPEGVGILNMKHRAKLLGGTVEWESGPSGSTVIIQLPIKQEEI